MTAFVLQAHICIYRFSVFFIKLFLQPQLPKLFSKTTDFLFYSACPMLYVSQQWHALCWAPVSYVMVIWSLRGGENSALVWDAQWRWSGGGGDREEEKQSAEREIGRVECGWLMCYSEQNSLEIYSPSCCFKPVCSYFPMKPKRRRIRTFGGISTTPF